MAGSAWAFCIAGIINVDIDKRFAPVNLIGQTDENFSEKPHEIIIIEIYSMKTKGCIKGQMIFPNRIGWKNIAIPGL